jgi:hypothetical protein
MNTYVNLCIYVSRQLFLKMRNVSDKSCRENQNTPFVFNKVLCLDKEKNQCIRGKREHRT